MAMRVTTPAFLPLCMAILSLTDASPAGAQDADGSVPEEPHQLVYTLATEAEVVMLDLASVSTDGDVRQAWSLVFLAQPAAVFTEASRPVSQFWVRSLIDCEAQTGRFVHAIGMEEARIVFDVAVTTPATPLDQAWPLDKEFLCENVTGFRISATTFSEAQAAAERVIGPRSEPRLADTAETERSDE